MYAASDKCISVCPPFLEWVGLSYFLKAGKTAREPTISYMSTNTYHLLIAEKGLEGNVHDKMKSLGPRFKN